MGKSYQWHNYIIEGLSPRHNVIQDKDDDGVKRVKYMKDEIKGSVERQVNDGVDCDSLRVVLLDRATTSTLVE